MAAGLTAEGLTPEGTGRPVRSAAESESPAVGHRPLQEERGDGRHGLLHIKTAAAGHRPLQKTTLKPEPVGAGGRDEMRT